MVENNIVQNLDLFFINIYSHKKNMLLIFKN